MVWGPLRSDSPKSTQALVLPFAPLAEVYVSRVLVLQTCPPNSIVVPICLGMLSMRSLCCFSVHHLESKEHRGKRGEDALIVS